jgi:hypothetical protein
VNTNLPLGTGAGNLPQVEAVAPANRGFLADDDPGAQGVQATITVTFSDYMDETAVLSGISVMNTTSGQYIGGLIASYDADARKLYVRHLDWPGSSAYLLVMTSGGIKNRWGTNLDGNGNGTDEGSPYDDALTTFYTSGSTPDSCVEVLPPQVTTFSPDTERVADTLQTISVGFSTAMDTTTLVAANFLLVSETQAPYPLDRVSMTPDSVSFRPKTGLRYGDRYYLTVTSGSIKSAPPANTPEYLKALDSDEDGAEAVEADLKSYFLCDTMDAPTVSSAAIADGMRFDFDQLMNTATLTLGNVRVFDDEGYVPGSLVYLRGPSGTSTRVEYYFSRPVSGILRAFASHLAVAENGRKLDGQERPNGIGGETWDDYWQPR